MQSFARLSREDFLEWVASGGTSRAATKRAEPFSGTVDLKLNQIGLLLDSSSHENTSSPLIIINDESVRDFFAWTSTYISSYFPLTAFFRVVTISTLARLDVLDSRGEFVPDDTRRLLSSSVVAEAITQTNGFTRPLAAVSLQACKSTLSYALLRSAALHYHPLAVGEVTEKWLAARRHMGNRQLRLPAEKVQAFWLLVFSSLLPTAPKFRGDKSNTTELVQELVQGASRGISFENLATADFVSKTFPALDLKALSSSTLAREEQIKALDQLAAQLGSSDIPPILQDSLVAYFAARLGNGSFEFFPLLAEFSEKFPSCPLWFSLFSIWQPGFDGLTSGNCLGRRVARDLDGLDSAFSPPNADISLAEFEVIVQSGRGAWVRSDSVSGMTVELVPNICCRLPSAAARSQPEGETLSLPEMLRLRRLLDQAKRILDDPIHRGSSAGPPQEDMFADERDRPRYPRGRGRAG